METKKLVAQMNKTRTRDKQRSDKEFDVFSALIVAIHLENMFLLFYSSNCFWILSSFFTTTVKLCNKQNERHFALFSNSKPNGRVKMVNRWTGFDVFLRCDKNISTAKETNNILFEEISCHYCYQFTVH